MRRRIILAVLCVAASITAYGQEKKALTSDSLLLPGELLDIGGKPGFLFLPADSKRSNPQPWIMYAPTLLPQYPDAHEKWMHEQFLSAGIAIAGIDAGESYGSPAGNEAIDQLYNLLVERRGFAQRPCLLGRSRGGLWVSSWAISNPSKVAGIACIYPVFDLTTYPGVAKAAPAYGLTPDELNQKLDRFNPIRNVRKLAEAKIPVTIIHGAIDEVVPLKQNSAQLKTVYEQAGQQSLVNLVVVEDQGHNFWPGFFRCQELIDFAIARTVGKR